MDARVQLIAVFWSYGHSQIVPRMVVFIPVCGKAPTRQLLHRMKGGGTHLLLALVLGPLTTHPFRDGAPFLPLTETPPIFERSWSFCEMYYLFFLLNLSPSCFAFCGHRLSPRIYSDCFLAIIIEDTKYLHICLFASSPLLQHISFLLIRFTFAHNVGSPLCCFATRAHLYVHLIPPPDL